MKKRLKSVGRWICETFDCDVKVFVDTAPVLEKPIAQTAGVGWQGKHTNLVSRQFGSWLFLGEIYTTLDIEPMRPCQITAAVVGSVSMFVRPMRLTARTAWMPESVFPI